MKTGIEKDEFYPYYVLNTIFKDYEVEVTELFFRKAERIDREFREMQKELKNLYEKASEAP